MVIPSRKNIIESKEPVHTTTVCQRGALVYLDNIKQMLKPVKITLRIKQIIEKKIKPMTVWVNCGLPIFDPLNKLEIIKAPIDEVITENMIMVK